MALPVSLNSRVWSAKGTKPATGDEVYSAGEQPIAPYDNWAMWSVTRDIYNITDELGNHADHHEVGGSDELDLQNLQVNGVVAFNGDDASDEYRWVDPETETSVARVDVADERIRQWPAFAIAPELREGADLRDDVIRNGDANVQLYDYQAGDDGKFHHAKYADNAGHADEADDVVGYDLSEFLTPDSNTTITGDWDYDLTVDADISGNADTADHADEADHATTADSADYASTAGDSDTVDGYHASELLAELSSEGEWDPVATVTHSTVGQRFDETITSDPEYDIYRITIYHESHKTSGPKSFFWFRIGKDGVDKRERYRWREMKITEDRWTGHRTSAGFTVAGAWPDKVSVTVLYATLPKAVNSPTYHKPVVGNSMEANAFRVPQLFHYGVLQTDLPYINTFEFRSDGNVSTGKIAIEGRNI